MTVITLSSREFNQDSSRAKKAAEHDPTFITDRGKPAHALLTIDDYRKLAGQEMTLADALVQPDGPEFDPPRAGGIVRPPDLS